MKKTLKTLLKTASWRIVGALDTFVLSYLITGHASAAVGIVGLEVATKSVWCFAHEKAWESSWVANLFSMEEANAAAEAV